MVTSHYRFFLDGQQTLKIEPGEGGFWKFGEFEKTDSKMFNPWRSDGSHMAPFDREVGINEDLSFFVLGLCMTSKVKWRD